MKRLWLLPALTIIAVVSGAKTASAAYCGAISYEGCGGCEGSVVDGGIVDGEGAGENGSAGTYTVMRTVREVVYDRVEETRYRTRNEVYYEDKEIQCTRMVPETRTKTVNYTVMVPTYET